MAVPTRCAGALVLSLMCACAVGDASCRPEPGAACDSDDGVSLLQRGYETDGQAGEPGFDVEKWQRERELEAKRGTGEKPPAEIKLETMPTTIPQSCDAVRYDTPEYPLHLEGANLIAQWARTCRRGVPDGRWSYAPTGEKLGKDEDLCNNALSCKTRLEACWSKPHLVYDGPNPSGMLVVFLGGTSAPPEVYQRVLKAAARAGHKVIGLSYLFLPIATLQTDIWCQPSPPGYVSTPSQCIQEIHHQTIWGNSSVPDKLKGKSGGLWPTEDKDSIEALVTDVIKKKGWDIFLRNGQDKVDWKRVIISGHSQGASHAAYLSQLEKVQLVLFGGPQELSPGGKHWLDLEVPKAVKRRSMSHLHEECAVEPKDPKAFCVAGQLEENLKTMGFGRASYWNGTGLPSDLENVVCTFPLENNAVRAYHRSTARDYLAPPGADKLWEAMFTGFSPQLGNL